MINVQIPPIVKSHIECLCDKCETQEVTNKKTRVLKKTIIMGIFLSACLAFCVYTHAPRVLAMGNITADISNLALAKEISIIVFGYFAVGINLVVIGNLLAHGISVVSNPRQTPEFISYFTIQ
jgi:hypothetical protein